MEVFQIKDLTANVLPGGGVLLGPNCRISATDPVMPECAPRSAGPRPPCPPKTSNPPPHELSALCGKDPGQEHDRGQRRAAGLEVLRRELRATLGPS